MTSIIRCLDVEIENPQLKPVYVPFVAEPGLIAGWRFGSGMNDLSGNGNTLTAIGAPTSDNFFISGDKDNGFMTTVPDGLQRTLVAIVIAISWIDIAIGVRCRAFYRIVFILVGAEYHNLRLI